MTREYLLTKFVCAKCGSNLEITHDTPGASGKYATGEPTGASVVNQLVAVKPCQPCAEPLARLRNALKVIQTEGGAA